MTTGDSSPELRLDQSGLGSVLTDKDDPGLWAAATSDWVGPARGARCDTIVRRTLRPASRTGAASALEVCRRDHYADRHEASGQDAAATEGFSEECRPDDDGDHDADFAEGSDGGHRSQ